MKKIFTLLLVVLSFSAFSQKYKSNNVGVIITGTSTLHDWSMKSSSGTFESVFVLDKDGAVISVSNLVFSVMVSTLKSDHDAMDKNAYKSLKTEKITYTSNSMSVKFEDGVYKIKSLGVLSIGDKNTYTDVLATCKVNKDRSISITSIKNLSMKEFGVLPPSFMMGTIKTGNDIALQFHFSANL